VSAHCGSQTASFFRADQFSGLYCEAKGTISEDDAIAGWQGHCSAGQTVFDYGFYGKDI